MAWTLSVLLVLGAGGATYLFWEDIVSLFAPQPDPVVITGLAEADPDYAQQRFVYTPLTYADKNHADAVQTYGVSLVEGADFCVAADTSFDDAKAEIDTAVKLAKTVSANTVWLPVTVRDGKVLLGSAEYADRLCTYAVEQVRGAGLAVGFAWAPMGEDVDPTVPSQAAAALENARLLAALAPDTVTLFDCGYAEGQGSMRDYMSKNLTVGFEVYKRNKISDFLSNLADILVRDGKTAVGLGVDPVWQLAEHHVDGISIAADFEAYSDAYADTVGWINSGIFSYVAVRNFGSLSDEDQPFEKIYDWWENAALGAGVRLYMIHAGEKVASDADGWKLYDQLPKQVLEVN
ncbi:MAG: family 10 glycosylhydrolase, partial [Clostridia bacterium]|nr:family 10 glycosylhydrolase [Clostridia bacterium]